MQATNGDAWMDYGENGPVRFGDFEFNSLSGKLFLDGISVKIQPQPLRVLAVLLERPGGIVSREQLRTRVWGNATFVEFDQGLNYCIRQIRVALGDEASKPHYIETLPKQGYRFIASVTPKLELAPRPLKRWRFITADRSICGHCLRNVSLSRYSGVSASSLSWTSCCNPQSTGWAGLRS